MLEKIPVGQLQQGMVLGKDILGKDALTLLSRGRALDEKNIAYLLRQFGPHREVVIYIPDDLTLPDLPPERERRNAS